MVAIYSQMCNLRAKKCGELYGRVCPTDAQECRARVVNTKGWRMLLVLILNARRMVSFSGMPVRLLSIGVQFCASYHRPLPPITTVRRIKLRYTYYT